MLIKLYYQHHPNKVSAYKIDEQPLTKLPNTHSYHKSQVSCVLLSKQPIYVEIDPNAKHPINKVYFNAKSALKHGDVTCEIQRLEIK